MSEQSITAIVPARAGSKGIPGKNMWAYDGVPLLARAIRLGLHCSRVSRVVVSTDSEDMQALALAEGAVCPALRPAELATDNATSADVVRHVIDSLKVETDHILLLQVTSPLRRLADCNAFLNHYLGAGAPAAVSIAKHDEPRPEKLKRFERGVVTSYLEHSYEGPRQTLPQPYALNGAFYAIARNVFLAQNRFLPEGTVGFEMPPERSHNLDSPQDLRILEAMLAGGHWQMENLPRR